MPDHATNLYTRDAVAAMDAAAIHSGIAGYTLMRRAGAAVLSALKTHYPDAVDILVVCGAGNNAGDGYVLARLAKQQGCQVTVCSLVATDKLKGDAALACAHWREVGEVRPFDAEYLNECDVIVDAMLGSGLTREVQGEWKQCIDAINRAGKPVIAVDIPSGLHADSGVIQGAAVEADITVCFIGLKQGMFTASGKQCCGEVIFDDLSVPENILQQQTPSAYLLNHSILDTLPRRRHDSHKGDYGHLLVVGGNHGMAGAVALAARAALRTGAGRVSVVTRPQHVAVVTGLCPEAMTHASEGGQMDESLLEACSHVVIGPGLGQDAWANRLLYQIRQLDKPVLYDADALNLLAQSQTMPANAAVVTPHPGEASRLCHIRTADIQRQRYDAVRQCYEKTQAVSVLKGSGTLVHDGETTQVCGAGSPAMASAGMGDVLSGVIGALLAQGCSTARAAALGVCAHALAAESAARGADRGLLASDVIEALPQVWR